MVLACDISLPGDTGEPEEVFQTTILSIDFDPDTLIAGDTLTIHCLISDSLDNRFKFKWNLNSDRILPFNGVIDSDVIRWRSKEDDINGYEGNIILFSGSVEVYDPENDNIFHYPAYEAFNIKIKRRE